MRGGSFAGLVLVTVCGIFTAYGTLQPELEKQRQGRLGHFAEEHQTSEAKDRQLSQAIRDDLEEARREALAYQPKGGFAWGIRQWISGKPLDATSTATKATPAQKGDLKVDDK
ncbi:hypothetical protein DOTSEDRAFT_19169 [Dothistroma septosporum NZE10]|uniref:Uncharacterized protein n=1 Tax=Dothistroma septosporum (strain NZE10 / CBS 128990) TaxID=675120 RepID=N1PZ06_DOTSN|nr:hypothetical protein DOTSEDRAFT_19169 [Dothistroma septosporum NZE10]